jgi:hypothetical protein
MRCVPVLLILAGCATSAPKIEVREVPGPTVYVAIDAKMTAHPPLPPLVTTSPIQCPEVADSRRNLLRDAYLQLDAIRAIQGTPVP